MENNGVKLVRCGDYIAASDGKIYKLNWKRNGIMKQIQETKTKKGYFSFSFNGKMVSSHRFIAMCFIPNPNNLPQVNHKNENKTDNRVKNLEWCDCKYNINYGSRNIKASKRMTNHPSTSKKVLQFTKTGVFVAKYTSIHEAERQTGVNIYSISGCCKGKQKTAGGFVWRHAD